MASLPFNSPSPRNLMTLGLFVFGMDNLPYEQLRHSMEWRHAATERHHARPAGQYLGPGAETVTLTGSVVPGIAGRYSSFDRLIEMADTGEDCPLMDGTGRCYGQFIIKKLDREHSDVMAAGLPRKMTFTLELERVADRTEV